ncbi:replication protein A 70 kDa DNA-binding subunit A-like [Rutidosis leptorrhynchoides]|uniref:replication protein A 70 kDa DNA-binding subunit A-like n=1 Tax=Rutidosis leptorrhynchoides TaxID=125765 RepID=UPI003A9A56D7
MSRSNKIISVQSIDGRQVNFQLKVKVVRVIKKLGHGFDAGKPVMEFIVSDDMGHKIVVNIRNALLSKFDELIKEWANYCMSYPVVVDSPICYRSKHVKHDCLTFIPFEHLIENELAVGVSADVIGRVSCYGPLLDFKNSGELKNKYINLQLKDLVGLEVDATLWGQFAVDFEHHIKNVSDDSSVILIIQFGKSLSCLPTGIKPILNEIHSTDDSVGSLAPFMSIMPPRDRNPKSWFKDAKHLERYLLVEATINTILPDDLWYYIAYKKCNKSAKPVTPNYDLTLDIDQQLALERKFKVPIRVENPSGTASFTVFETVVKKFVNKTAYDLMKELSEDDDYPEQLEAFLEKTLLFKIEVSNYNNDRGIRNYTVKDATDDPEYLEIFQLLKVDHGIEVVDAEPSSSTLTSSVNITTLIFPI